jgi:hypothetical protein
MSVLDSYGNYNPNYNPALFKGQEVMNRLHYWLRFCGCEDINTLLYNHTNREHIRIIFNWMIIREFPKFIGIDIRFDQDDTIPH